jgi:DNA-binding transcriptional MocR family regulator
MSSTLARANKARLVSPTEAERELVNSLGHWPAGPEPLYQRLAEALHAAIDREIPVGATLPPERRLAELLHVSRTTVVAAYRILRQEGLLQSRQGSGTRVAAPARTDRMQRPLALGSVAAFRGLIDRRSGVIDFSAAAIGSEGILTEELQARAAGELSSLTRTPGYHPYGLPSLRQAIAQRLAENGLSTNDQQILVTSGAQQAINLLAQLLVERGSCVVVENPTYVGALDAFAAAGARMLGIPVQEQQGSPEPLRRLLRRERPRLLYLMPTFHNPTGAVSTLARREQLAALTAEQQTPLIQDDTLATPAIGRTPPPPIATFDRDGHVITIGSLSKSAWAGLRVGWIRAPVSLVDRLVRLKTVADLGSSLPSQTLARAVLDDFARVSALRASQLGDCLALASRLLRERLPDWRFADPAGGQSLWLRLPGGDGDSFAQTALKHGVTVVPGSLLSPDRSFRDHIRLQFLQPPELIEEGVHRLARAWDDYAAAASHRDLTVVV